MASQTTRNRYGRGKKRKRYENAVPGSTSKTSLSRRVRQRWLDSYGRDHRTVKDALAASDKKKVMHGFMPVLWRTVER